MTHLKKYDLSGKKIGEVAVAQDLLEKNGNSQMIKDYLVAIRNNRRQWCASTKTRAEVCHSGQKPHPQKGTGRARQGYLGATQYKGGGRPKGPKGKVDQHVSINKKEKRAAIRHLLIEKIESDSVVVLKEDHLKEPKTKKVAQFLKTLEFQDRRVVFLGLVSKQEDLLIKSLRNLPKVEFVHAPNLNGYELVRHAHIVVLEPAVDELLTILKG